MVDWQRFDFEVVVKMESPLMEGPALRVVNVVVTLSDKSPSKD